MTYYHLNVLKIRYMYTLYHLHKFQNGNTADIGTQLVDQKLNVGAYSTWGELQQVFFLQHGQAFLKSPELHL